jgi:hypothetical protein
MASVGLAAILLGAGAGVVWMRQGDSGPTRREGSIASTKGSTVPTPAVSPTPVPTQDPKVGTDSQQAVAARPPDPQPETPPAIVTQPPPAHVETPAQPETPEPGPVTVPQKDPKVVVGKTRNPSPPRARGTGALQIVSRCWADVFIDGVKVARSPVAFVPVAAGRRLLELRGNARIKEERKRVVIPVDGKLEYSALCEPTE